MGATVAVVQCAPMAGYRPGNEARRAMLAELLRREEAGEPAPSLRELAACSGRSRAQGFRHLQALKAADLIDWRPAVGRLGTEVRFTDCGREAARLLAD